MKCNDKNKGKKRKKEYAYEDKKYNDHEDQGKKYDDKKYDDDKDDDKNYSYELEEVFEDYACGNPKARKVLICHYPPGNPAARHEICIGVPALKAHLEHGDASHKDHLGECKDDEAAE